MHLSQESQRKLAFIAGNTHKSKAAVLEAIIAEEYERLCKERIPGIPESLITRFELAWDNQLAGIQYLFSLSR